MDKTLSPGRHRAVQLVFYMIHLIKLKVLDFNMNNNFILVQVYTRRVIHYKLLLLLLYMRAHAEVARRGGHGSLLAQGVSARVVPCTHPSC